MNLLFEISSLLESEGFETDWLKNNLIQNTFCLAVDKGKIIGFLRFEIKGCTAEVVQCVIDKNFRYSKVLNKLTQDGIRKFPYVKNISWERGLRGGKKKTFKVERIKRRLSNENIN